jgi:hypothetical protein
VLSHSAIGKAGLIHWNRFGHLPYTIPTSDKSDRISVQKDEA